MDIRFTITNDDMVRGIERALRAGKDFTPAMRAVAGLMEAETRDRFEVGKDPSGEVWTPSQRARKEGGRTLVDRGALRDSIASAFDAGSAIAGTNVIYAAIHQFGGTIQAIPKSKGGKGALRTPFGPKGSVKMPARPFLGFGASDREAILDILAAHLANAFGDRAGGARP